MGATRPPIPLVYRFVALVMRPLLRLLLRYEVQGEENIPLEGGFIVAANHNSHSDPFPWAHVLYNRGIPPVFLAKDALFKVPVIAWVMLGEVMPPLAWGGMALAGVGVVLATRKVA